MKSRVLFCVAIILLILVWPPVYSHFFRHDVESYLNGPAGMSDSDLQRLLDAKRWVIDIPADKDGYFLELQSKSEDEISHSGGVSVRGGKQLVLLTRRDRERRKIYYSWSQDGAGAWGSIDDPVSGAGSSGETSGGFLEFGEPIYFGNKGATLQMYPRVNYDFEVSVLLKSPKA
jgi:hypothetical protein